MSTYLAIKVAHVVLAIVALGSSAGLGVLLELYGDDPKHGAFLLRAIRRIEHLVVLPGYVLMLVTGLWMVRLAWSLRTHWIEAALALWLVGALLLGAYVPILRRQIALAEAGDQRTPAYRRLSLMGRALGAASGLAVLLIVYLMVAKPAIAWWPFP